MKNKKLAALTLAALIAASLCGCDNNGASDNEGSSDTNSATSDTASTDSTPDSAPESGEDSTPESTYPVLGEATFLVGAAGDIIGTDEITSVRNEDGEEIPAAELTADNFSMVTTDSAYYTTPRYPVLTNRDNADEYDAENSEFKNIPWEEIVTEQKKVKAGDEICGLTVKSAKSYFVSSYPGYMYTTHIEFDDEATFEGYAYVEPEDEYNTFKGDIKFIPTGEFELPLVNFHFLDENGKITHSAGMPCMVGDFVWTSEYETFYLGNVNNETADISDIPQDGTVVKVKIVVSNIMMDTTLDGPTRLNAEIVSVTAI